VVVDDFNVKSICPVEAKAQSPLIVDADTAKPFAVTFKPLEAVIGRHPQIVYSNSAMQHRKFPLRNSAEIDEPRYRLSEKQGLGLSAAERTNHLHNISHIVMRQAAEDRPTLLALRQ
jgi:hypothetical protein